MTYLLKSKQGTRRILHRISLTSGCSSIQYRKQFSWAARMFYASTFRSDVRMSARGRSCNDPIIHTLLPIYLSVKVRYKIAFVPMCTHTRTTHALIVVPMTASLFPVRSRDTGDSIAWGFNENNYSLRKRSRIKCIKLGGNIPSGPQSTLAASMHPKLVSTHMGSWFPVWPRNTRDRITWHFSEKPIGFYTTVR